MLKNDKFVFRLVMGLSIFVFVAVVVLNRKIIPRPDNVPEWIYKLPTLNACINATCALLLLVSFYYIRRKRIETHKRINILTFFLSCMFLVSYITYHWLAEETSYPKDNPLRYLYYCILISHIVLSVVVLPMVLMSFHRGLQMQVAKHRKLVRWAFPIWLYVCITGVVVYLMISPFYTH